MSKHTQLRYWIDELPKKGKTTFSLKEAESQFPDKSISGTRRALARLADSRKVHSVWKGFYSIALSEYGLEGIAPPIDYIDQLMRYLECGYYISLLTAASYYGAAHQSPQVFQVMCNKILHVKVKNGVKVEPVYKKDINFKYVSDINSRTALVKISSPELIAIDLLLYMKRVGGINHVATVLSELAESIDFRHVDADFFKGVPVSVIQRLGFILDETLGEKSVADGLYKKIKQIGISFNPTPLVVDKKSFNNTYLKNKKWNINVNYEVESDL